MAELMGPFDPASPCLTTFCKRISKEDFEKQASDYTENALAELIEYLEYNPTAYHNILRKRKREDAEKGGILSYIKAKMLTTVFGDEYLERVDEREAKQKLAALKDDIRSSYDYAEEAKGSGKRFSKRIANRKKLITIGSGSDENIAKKLEYDLTSSSQSHSTSKATTVSKPDESQTKQTSVIPKPPPPPPVLPPPPPPPPQPPLCAQLPSEDNSKQTRQTNKQTQGSAPLKRIQPNANKMEKQHSESVASQLMASISNPNTRAALKPVGDPDITPYQKRHLLNNPNSDKENDFPLFNQQLITKFQNTRSPKSPVDSSYMSDVSSPDSFATSP